jgi:hypothetical protein
MFKPMLATDAELDKLRFPILCSPKLDGIRAVVRGGVVYSRSNKPIPNKWVQSKLSHLEHYDGELIVAPSSFLRSGHQCLNKSLSAFASGWMAQGQGGGQRYGHASGYDHGFTMSDHADWDDLLRSVRESGARRVYVQHRGTGALVRKLRAEGLEAYSDQALAPQENKDSRKEKPSQLALF